MTHVQSVIGYKVTRTARVRITDRISRRRYYNQVSSPNIFRINGTGYCGSKKLFFFLEVSRIPFTCYSQLHHVFSNANVAHFYALKKWKKRKKRLHSRSLWIVKIEVNALDYKKRIEINSAAFHELINTNNSSLLR